MFYACHPNHDFTGLVNSLSIPHTNSLICRLIILTAYKIMSAVPMIGHRVRNPSLMGKCKTNHLSKNGTIFSQLFVAYVTPNFLPSNSFKMLLKTKSEMAAELYHEIGQILKFPSDCIQGYKENLQFIALHFQSCVTCSEFGLGSTRVLNPLEVTEINSKE